MSDNWLVFIPDDPHATPSQTALDAAVALLRRIAPNADEIGALVSEDIRFHDCGSNWSGVLCPRCAADIEDWWFEAVDHAYRSGYATLAATTPCCGLATTLNDVAYEWPAGFARVALQVRNPAIADTTADQDAALAAMVGTPLRKIWRHL